MSLKPNPIPPVPEVTVCVAHAAFPRGNVLMQLRDTLGAIYADEHGKLGEKWTDFEVKHGNSCGLPERLNLTQPC